LWCSRSYGAAPTAWGIDASPACITGECAINPLIVKRHCIDPTITRFTRNPCLPGYGVELDLISGIDSHPSTCISPAILCLHSLNHGLPFSFS
jgi:hypothetical protein